MLTHGGVVAGDFPNRRGNVLDDRAVARAVVGDHQIVVDRLWHPDDPQLVALLLGELGDLVGGILRVVSARVEEIANVVGLEYLEHPLEIGLLLQLVAHRTQRGARRRAQPADGLLGFGRQIDQVLLQDTQHAVQRAIDFLDALVVQRPRDDAGDAGIDDGSGASGLAHQDISYEFFSHGSGIVKGIGPNVNDHRNAQPYPLANPNFPRTSREPAQSHTRSAAAASETFARTGRQGSEQLAGLVGRRPFHFSRQGGDRTDKGVDLLGSRPDKAPGVGEHRPQARQG